MISIRVYGPSRAYSSFRAITRGYVRGFVENGCPVHHYPTDTDLDESDPPLGSGADIGIAFGFPRMAGLMSMHASHKRRFVMVAPNSNVIPAHMIRVIMEAKSDILTPSTWGAAMIRGVLEQVVLEEERPDVMVLPHGVGPEFYPSSKLPPRKASQAPFTALHITSTASSRKSTYETAYAFHRLCAAGDLPNGSLLTVSADIASLPHWQSRLKDLHGVEVAAGKNKPWGDMASYYRSFDAVVQPSRAEGFGLTPLESMCSGVPSVATACTGHLEWADPDTALGLVIVPNGDIADMSEDGEGAEAPEVRWFRIGEAIHFAYEQRNFLMEAAWASAPRLYEMWSWENVVKQWLKEMC